MSHYDASQHFPSWESAPIIQYELHDYLRWHASPDARQGVLFSVGNTTFYRHFPDSPHVLNMYLRSHFEETSVLTATHALTELSHQWWQGAKPILVLQFVPGSEAADSYPKMKSLRFFAKYFSPIAAIVCITSGLVKVETWARIVSRMLEKFSRFSSFRRFEQWFQSSPIQPEPLFLSSDFLQRLGADLLERGIIDASSAKHLSSGIPIGNFLRESSSASSSTLPSMLSIGSSLITSSSLRMSGLTSQDSLSIRFSNTSIDTASFISSIDIGAHDGEMNEVAKLGGTPRSALRDQFLPALGDSKSQGRLTLQKISEDANESGEATPLTPSTPRFPRRRPRGARGTKDVPTNTSQSRRRNPEVSSLRVTEVESSKVSMNLVKIVDGLVRKSGSGPFSSSQDSRSDDESDLVVLPTEASSNRRGCQSADPKDLQIGRKWSKIADSSECKGRDSSGTSRVLIRSSEDSEMSNQASSANRVQSKRRANRPLPMNTDEEDGSHLESINAKCNDCSQSLLRFGVKKSIQTHSRESSPTTTPRRKQKEEILKRYDSGDLLNLCSKPGTPGGSQKDKNRVGSVMSNSRESQTEEGSPPTSTPRRSRAPPALSFLNRITVDTDNFTEGIGERSPRRILRNLFRSEETTGEARTPRGIFQANHIHGDNKLENSPWIPLRRDMPRN